MRGQKKTVKTLTISGNIYLLHQDVEELENPLTGDIQISLYNEKEIFKVVLSNYKIKGYKGYFRAEIYDGYEWCFLNSQDFFDDRVNQFSRADICFYTFLACKERLFEYANAPVYRTYRDHYSAHLHVAGEFKGRKRKTTK